MNNPTIVLCFLDSVEAHFCLLVSMSLLKYYFLGCHLDPPSLHMIFWWLKANLLNTYIIKTSEDKYRYFKCNFNEKKLFYQFLVFFIWRNFDMPNVNLFLVAKKHFILKPTLSNTQNAFCTISQNNIQKSVLFWLRWYTYDAH